MTNTCVIIGGGIAGLSAGIAMRGAGYEVAVYEQAERIEPLGTALSIWGNAMAGLDRFGVGDALRQQAAPLRSIALSRGDGRPLMEAIDIAGSDSFLPRRGLLQKLLLERLGKDAVRLGERAVSAVQETDHARVAFANGETVEADLVIAANGIRSSTASALLGGAPVYAGYRGLLAVCRSTDGGWPQGRAEEFWHGSERFGLFDLGDDWRYWFYMASAGEDTADNSLAAIRASVNGTDRPWNDAIGTAVNATEESDTYSIAIYAKPPPKRLGHGRILCIGDAAHPMEPNQGQGGCQSIEDSWALGALARRLPPEAILPAFEKLRLKRVRGYVRNSALIGKAAHAHSSAARLVGRTIIAATPGRLNRRQIAAGFAPPDYG